jgi:hypothetical protein
LIINKEKNFLEKPGIVLKNVNSKQMQIILEFMAASASSNKEALANIVFPPDVVELI